MYMMALYTQMCGFIKESLNVKENLNISISDDVNCYITFANLLANNQHSAS